MEKEQEIWLALKKLYESAENSIKTDAIVSRAYTDKISTETIRQKVEAQKNAIIIGIHEINPKFQEGSKNYTAIQNCIVETMGNYEKSLIELSQFYDGKIEQLIIRKVELEANLVGALINEAYLKDKRVKREKQKDNDKVKNKIKHSIKMVFDKLSKKKNENKPLDVRLMNYFNSGKDVANEIEEKLECKVNKTKVAEKDNLAVIEKIEKEIRLTEEEIKKINERKKQFLLDAMEIGDKSLVTTIRKPRVFKKITRFFASRFNTSKVIMNTIIEPLNQRIEAFKMNELADIKG